MNDPHVEALIYVIEHDSTVSYKKAAPVEIERPGFRVRVEDGLARFELKEHYSIEREAMAAVQPYVDQWEFEESLRLGPGQFALRFDRAVITDRQPTPGVHSVSAGPVRWSFTVPPVEITVSRPYPPPPSEAPMDVHDPDVEVMHYRFTRYRRGYEPITSMAYFCLTMLEYGFDSPQRPKAAEHFGISLDVLQAIGRITAETGGRDARKAASKVGVPRDPTTQEVNFLEQAIKHLIMQAARVAVPDPDADLPTITMADLPPLSDK